MRTALPVLFALLLAGCASMGGGAQVEAPREISVEADATPAAQVLNSSMNGLVARTSPSYVNLIVHEGKKQQRDTFGEMPEALTSGSGFVIDGNGHVLTAAHVGVKLGTEVEAHSSDGRIYEGRVVAIQPDNDMSLVKLSNFTGSPVTPAASTCLKAGDPLFSLGRPHAQGDTARIGQLESMSFGRAVSYQGYGYPDAMVLRMNTRKGESGGPVFDANGDLVGMVVSTLSDGNGRPLNLAHAIPLSALAKFVCANTQCSERWQAVSKQNSSQCPAAIAVKG